MSYSTAEFWSARNAGCDALFRCVSLQMPCVCLGMSAMLWWTALGLICSIQTHRCDGKIWGGVFMCFQPMPLYIHHISPIYSNVIIIIHALLNSYFITICHCWLLQCFRRGLLSELQKFPALSMPQKRHSWNDGLNCSILWGGASKTLEDGAKTPHCHRFQRRAVYFIILHLSSSCVQR